MPELKRLTESRMIYSGDYIYNVFSWTSHQRNTSPEHIWCVPQSPLSAHRSMARPTPACWHAFFIYSCVFGSQVAARVTLKSFSFPRGKVWIACSHWHHSQCGGPRLWERPGEWGRRRDGKNEETQTKNHPDQKAGVHAHPLKLNWPLDKEVFQIILTERNLLLWKWPVTTLEVAAMIAVSEIPVHVAQERIKVLMLCISQCPWLSGMSGANLWV